MINITVTLSDTLLKDIENYTYYNGINVSEFMTELIKKGFMIEKYGNKPLVRNKMSKKEFEKIIENSTQRPYDGLEGKAKEVTFASGETVNAKAEEITTVVEDIVPPEEQVEKKMRSRKRKLN